jgi:type II secretion system protein F
VPDFVYEALDKAGKASSGTISARDPQDAAVKVRAMGVFPTSIGTGGKTAKNGTATAARNGSAAHAKTADSKAAPAAKTAMSSSRGKKITRTHILLFTREMADLLDAGLPIDRAYSVLIDQMEHEGFRQMLTAMQNEIRAGQPMSDALSKFPKQFPSLYTNMVRAGEVSGQLAGVLMRLADFLEKEQIRRSQIMAALTYPAVLISVAVLAVAFLLVWVIPQLSGVFKDMGSALPVPTQALLGISALIKQYWYLIILGFIGIFYGFRAWLNTTAGRRQFDTFRMNAPLFGKLNQKIVSARLVRTLGTLLGGGVPILEAMDISATAVGNVVATDSILDVRGRVRQGETLHDAMESNGGFLPVVKHMTAVGEETGRLPNMLLRTADTLDFEVDSAMRRLTSLVEPLVILGMGSFVGFVVLSILLPIFQANSLVK